MSELTQIKVDIARINSDDLLSLSELHARSWVNTYPDEQLGITAEWVKQYTDNWKEDEGLKHYTKYFLGDLSSPDRLNLKASVNGKLIGFIYATKKEDDSYHLAALHVDKDFHGTGVAQQLMDKFEYWADPSKSTIIEVVEYNDRAIAFYRKYGFVEVDESRYVTYEKIPCIYMIRKGKNNEV